MPEQDESPAPSRFYPLTEKMAREIENRFTYHRPQADQLPRYQEIREQAKFLALAVVRCTPPSREQALALTKLEEAVMHANSGIAREPRSVDERPETSGEATAPRPATDLAPVGG